MSTGTALRVVACVTAIISVGAFSEDSSAAKRVVGEFRVSVDAGPTTLNGKRSFLIRSITIRQKGLNRSKPMVRCGRRNCRRLAGRGRFRKQVRRNAVTFRNVNWILKSRETITVALHRRNRIGRYQAIGLKGSHSPQLVVRKAGCLKRRFVRRKCPSGTNQPRTNANVACNARSGRQMNVGPLGTDFAALPSGDFNADGLTDLAVFYNYDLSDTGLWTFAGTPSGPASPSRPWRSGPGIWDWSSVMPIAGDFNGDCVPEIASLYKIGASQTGLWTFRATGTNGLAPIFAWDSGAGRWEWDRTTTVTGDFNGDGFDDIAAFYNYTNSRTGVWLFFGSPTGPRTPVLAWDSGVGNWEWGRTKAVSGDFNGDGRDDLAAFYNYDENRSKIWIFAGTTSGIAKPEMKWDSGVGNWNWERTKAVAGDFNGDGFDDVAALYNYDAHTADTSGINLFAGSTGWLKNWTQPWKSAAGQWRWQATKLTAGDFNGDGRDDVVGFYNYGSGTSGTRMFAGTANGPAAAWTQSWSSTGWSWPRVR